MKSTIQEYACMIAEAGILARKGGKGIIDLAYAKIIKEAEAELTEEDRIDLRLVKRLVEMELAINAAQIDATKEIADTDAAREKLHFTDEMSLEEKANSLFSFLMDNGVLKQIRDLYNDTPTRNPQVAKSVDQKDMKAFNDKIRAIILKSLI